MISNDVWSQEAGATFTNSTGVAEWFDIEIRVSNGTGGYGFSGQGGGAWGSAAAGFLIKAGGDNAGFDESQYVYAEDNGSGNLFRHLGFSPVGTLPDGLFTVQGFQVLAGGSDTAISNLPEVQQIWSQIGDPAKSAFTRTLLHRVLML